MIHNHTFPFATAPFNPGSLVTEVTNKLARDFNLTLSDFLIGILKEASTHDQLSLWHKPYQQDYQVEINTMRGPIKYSPYQKELTIFLSPSVSYHLIDYYFREKAAEFNDDLQGEAGFIEMIRRCVTPVGFKLSQWDVRRYDEGFTADVRFNQE